MKTRWIVGSLLAVAILGIGFIVSFLSREEESLEELYSRTDTSSAAVEPTEEVPPLVSREISPRFRELEPGDVIEDVKDPKLLRHYGSAARTGEEDLRMVASVLERFWLRFKNPDLLRVGSNEEIMESLLGENPDGILFVSIDNEYLDTDGRLLDRWGTPLFFHSESMTRIEIRSSGPDRDRFTEDDILVQASSGLRLQGR